ncbi:MAG: asparagine synthase (glutamine-hydrolyzing) [Alsobacter sp.]
MCGLVAVLTPGPLDAGVLERMRDRLAHRGPDGANQWIGKAGQSSVGLAHRRLSIIDLSTGGTQPMFAADGQVAIVFNGEVFNYIELREELRALGATFRSDCDTEVLIQAYLVWGEECLSRLNGQFAFVIWDARRNEAFVARDRFGEKPLYYAPIAGGGLAIGSEMKALFAHPGIVVDVDHERLERFTRGIADYASRETLFRGISQLESAHAMSVTADGRIRRMWRYWTPDFADVRPIRTSDAVAEFRARLGHGMRLRLRSDVRVGACLSGGLDSSSLVGLMAGQGLARDGQLLHTISARFSDDPTLSEGAHIDAVLEHCGAVGLGVEPDPLRLAAESQALHWHQEIPFLSASGYLEWCVHRAARESGLTVMIDGQGADELMGGYQFYFGVKQIDWLNTGRWVELARQTSLHRRHLMSEAGKYDDVRRRFDPDAAGSVGPLLLTGIKNQFRKLLNRPPELAPQPNMRPGTPDPSGGRYFRYYLASGLLYDMLPNQLVMSDRNAMAFGIEARFPFLDYDLVDWCSHLPDEVLIHDGWQKWIMRESMNGVIPRNVQWRGDKVGFAAPQDRWLRGPLRDWAHDLLFSGPIASLQSYDRAALEVAWQEHLSGRDTSWQLWRWISASEWLRLSSSGAWKQGVNSGELGVVPARAASA